MSETSLRSFKILDFMTRSISDCNQCKLLFFIRKNDQKIIHKKLLSDFLLLLIGALFLKAEIVKF